MHQIPLCGSLLRRHSLDSSRSLHPPLCRRLSWGRRLRDEPRWRLFVVPYMTYLSTCSFRTIERERETRTYSHGWWSRSSDAAIYSSREGKTKVSGSCCFPNRWVLGKVRRKGWIEAGFENWNMHSQLCGEISGHFKLCCQSIQSAGWKLIKESSNWQKKTCITEAGVLIFCTAFGWRLNGLAQHGF